MVRSAPAKCGLRQKPSITPLVVLAPFLDAPSAGPDSVGSNREIDGDGLARWKPTALHARAKRKKNKSSQKS